LSQLANKTAPELSRLSLWPPTVARRNPQIELLLTTGIIATIAVAADIAVIIALRVETNSLSEASGTKKGSLTAPLFR